MYNSYWVNSVYTLKDKDVLVYEGVIISCNYNFQANRIIIPNVLDGQTVIGIADAKVEEEGIFARKGIMDIQLPTTLEFIGDYAFSNNDLDSLDLSNNLALERIGQYAFAWSHSYKFNTSNTGSLKYIEGHAFDGNYLSKVDLGGYASLQEIGPFAFSRNRIDTVGLKSCSSLKKIGEQAFFSNRIAEVDISGCSLIDTIGSMAFYGNQISKIDTRGCSNLTCIAPAAFNSNIVDTLDGKASNGLIYGRTIVGSVDSSTIVSYGGISKHIDFLTAGIKAIGDSAFMGAGLTSIDFGICSGLEKIGKYSFISNDIKELDLSSNASLKSIEDYAFNNNDIKSLNLVGCNNLEHIGVYAFYSNAIDTLDLSNKNKLTEISTSAFASNTLNSLNLEGCTALKEIGISAFSQNALDTVDFSSNTALSGIGYYAFAYNNIAKLILGPNSTLSRIGVNAFYSNSLDTVDLSTCKELVSIGKNAFGLNLFDGFVLPTPNLAGFENWTDMDHNMLAGGDTATNLFSYYLAVLPEYTLTDDDVEVIDGVIVKAGNSFKSNNIIIPQVLDGQVIVGISDGFSYMGVFERKGLLSVAFPSSIEFIGQRAFKENQLRTVDLSQAKSLTNIDNYAFYYNEIDSISFDSCAALQTINDYSFYYNSILQLDLNNCKNLGSIGSQAFYGNNLDTVLINLCTSLTEIGYSAFSNNPDITGFEIPTPIVDGYDFLYWNDSYSTQYDGGAWIDDLSLTYIAVLESLTYTVSFNITDMDGNPLSGATIELYGYGSRISNNDGIASFLAVQPDSNIVYTANATGNNVLLGSITVSDSDVTEYLKFVRVTYTVSFSVTKDNVAVDGATVVLGNIGTEFTNSSGQAVFSAIEPQNGIDYTVSLDGFDDITGTVDVVDSDVPVSVNFNTVGIENPAEALTLRVYPVPASDIIHIEGINTERAFIYNIRGELVLEQDVAISENTMDISSLNEGLYFLSIAGKLYKISVVR